MDITVVPETENTDNDEQQININNTGDEGKENDIADDNILVEEESPDDTYVTIYVINFAREINIAQMTDIPGTFLHRDTEQDIHMLLESSIAMLIVKL